VLDRFIQQAVMQVLPDSWDRTFSEHSYGFRPGRSAHQAVAQAQIAQGYGYVVDIDLEKFFDRVNHDILMGLAAQRVKDQRALKLLRAFLNAGVLENGLVSPATAGTPQGGPLSPLLSNLMLDMLDKELERCGHRFVRYADDCNIYVRSVRAGERVMASISRFLEKKLKLKVNQGKSAVGRPGERKFLGFSFTKGREPKRLIQAASPGTDPQQPPPGSGPPGASPQTLSDRLAELLWLLRSSVVAAAAGLLAAASPQDGVLAAMAAGPDQVCRIMQTGSGS
jgi:RNA-directed DNA polymerase